MIKKYFKKLVSVALSAVMVMGMSVTAFAAEPQTSEIEKTISANGYDFTVYILQSSQTLILSRKQTLNPLAILLIVQKYSLLL